MLAVCDIRKLEEESQKQNYYLASLSLKVTVACLYDLLYYT